MDLNDCLSRGNFHQCNICLHKTKSILLMRNHLREHHKIARNSQEVFNCSSELDKCKCLKCDYRTPFKVNLKRHVCSTNPQENIDLVKTYNCENCDFQTSSCLMLGKHIYYDCKNVISNCDQKVSVNCKNNDGSGKNIDCFENETVKIEWNCSHCFYKAKSKNDLRKHVDQEHLFTERNNILNKSNNNTPTTKEIQWFKCKNCTFQSKHKCNLNTHILLKHTAPEKRKWFKCQNCLYQSNLNSSLKKHILWKHTPSEKVKWFECKSCPYKSRMKGALNRHVATKHTPPIKLEWFKCANCSFQTIHKRSLSKHILSQHTAPEKVKWFKCDNCLFQSKHKGSLNKHILVKHAAPQETEWLKCTKCLCKIEKKQDLSRHILPLRYTRTENIKWFECENCKTECKTETKSDLVSHIRTVMGNLLGSACQKVDKS